MKTHSRFLKLPMNTMGRDFVVGDLHGAYDMVFEAMEKVDFDPLKDRILSVGDLVDKGLESARCLDFLDVPGVQALRGNHEQNLLYIFANGPPDDRLLDFYIKRFSMDWLRSVSPEKLQLILERFEQLPIAMQVATRRGSVGLVHGEVPVGMNWPDFISAVQANDSWVVGCALEGRDRIEFQDHSGVAGIDRVFVGHTPQKGGPKQFGNVYAIDTGAILRPLMGVEEYGLTFANILTSTESLFKPGDGTVEEVSIFNDSPSQPFGDYSQIKMP